MSKKLSAEAKDKELKVRKTKMMDVFRDVTLAMSRVPSGDEFYRESGYSRAEVRTLFVNYMSLLESACDYHKFALKNIFTPRDFSPQKQKALLKEFTKYDSVIITTAQPKAPVNRPFLQSLRHLAKAHKAMLIVLKTKGEALFLDSELKNEFILLEDMHLNSNITIWHVESNATAASIAKGFKRYTSVESSLILPSMKQEMHPVPNMGKLPRAVFSTGAVTLPLYGNTPVERKAREDHFPGAYLIDLKGDKLFFPHNIDALPDGALIHKGVLYRSNGTTRKLDKSEVVRVCGDDHAYIHSPRVAKVLDDVQKRMPAHMKVSHDTWDQHISNHHNMKNNILLAQMAERGEDRIEKERIVTREFIKRDAMKYDQVLCVSSNHNEALARFNAEGRYMDEHQNWRIGHMTSLAQFHGIDPVEFAVNFYDAFDKALAEYFELVKQGKKATVKLVAEPVIQNVRFLRQGEDFKWGGYSLGFHGDEGSGGSKGTVDAMAFIHSGNTASYDAGVVTGHTHSSYKRNRSINVGTSTALPHEEDAPGYAKGTPNAWFNSFADIYQPREYNGIGTAQLFLIIDDAWEVTSKKPKSKLRLVA